MLKPLTMVIIVLKVIPLSSQPIVIFIVIDFTAHILFHQPRIYHIIKQQPYVKIRSSPPPFISLSLSAHSSANILSGLGNSCFTILFNNSDIFYDKVISILIHLRLTCLTRLIAGI